MPVLALEVTESIIFYPFSVVKDLKYADTHEWVKVDGTSATVGITDHAQVLYLISSIMQAKCFFDF